MTLRHRLISISTGASLLFGSALWATTALADSDHSFVTGAAWQGCHYEVSAHTLDTEGPARGQINVRCPAEGLFQADVTCMLVTGNHAYVTAVIETGARAGQQEVLEVIDNGEPQNGQPDDLARVSFVPFIQPSAEPGCSLPVLPPLPIESGNLTVHQGTP
jgi:hypothetical protein